MWNDLNHTRLFWLIFKVKKVQCSKSKPQRVKMDFAQKNGESLTFMLWRTAYTLKHERNWAIFDLKRIFILPLKFELNILLLEK